MTFLIKRIAPTGTYVALKIKKPVEPFKAFQIQEIFIDLLFLLPI